MSIATARAALVETIKQIPEFDQEVYGWPNQTGTVPMAHVLCDTIDPDVVLDGDKQRLTFIVRVLIGRADFQAVTDNLDPFLAPAGVTIRGLINDDPTLGGQVDSARVTQIDSDRVFEIGGLFLVGAEFRVDVVG